MFSWKLKGQLISGYLLLAVFFGIFGVYSYIVLNSTQEKIEEFNTEDYPLVNTIHSIQSVLSAQANDERGFLLTGQDSYLQEMEQRTTEARKKINLLNKYEEFDPAKVKRIEEQYQAFVEANHQVSSLYKAGKTQEAKNYSLKESRAIRKSLEADLERLIAAANEELLEDLKEGTDDLNNDKLVTVLTSFVLLMLGILIGYWQSKQLAVPIARLVTANKALAAGDLRVQELAFERRDEIGELVTSFNVMLRNLKDLVTQSSESSVEVANTSNSLSTIAVQASRATQQVAAAMGSVTSGNAQQNQRVDETVKLVDELIGTIEQIACGAQEQARNVSQTALLVEDMARGIEQVSENANQVALTTAQTAETAHKGGEAVERTINGMQKIKFTVLESANKIKELGDQSKQIGEIIQVIDDIAEQTNLLALNAAIEAARAGEHGKGFAVVADEVRKLAERSGKATKEIADLVTNIQRGTNNAVSAMELGTEHVENGAVLADEAGEALKAIITTINKANQQVQAISQAAQQIAQYSADVVKAIDNVAAITEQNTAGTEEMAASSNLVQSTIRQMTNITRDNTESTQEVSAATEEVTASTEEIAASARVLAELSSRLQQELSQFRL